MAHGGDLSGVLAALKGLTERVEGVEGRVTTLAETIEKGAEDDAQEPDEAPQGSNPGPIWWPALPDDEYARLRGELKAWLRDVLAARYPRDAGKLTVCWEAHPAAVDALTKAWLTWWAVEKDPTADARDAADWQTRWRPDLVALAAADLRTCRDQQRHERPDPLDPDLLASFEPVADR